MKKARSNPSSLKNILPSIYENVFSDKLLKIQQVETKANCESCSMSPGRTRTKITYHENLKCCTFYPFQPNYLVGAILKDSENNLGAEVIRENIRQRKFVLPIGALATLKYQHAFQQRAEGDFGNREDWLCPYYNKQANNCNIWQHRGAVCSTFYCKSNSGAAGKRFWHHVSQFLTYAEMALLEDCLIHLDFSPRQISDQLDFLNRMEFSKAEAKMQSLPEAPLKKLWNGYYDEQESFFIKCHDWIENLSRKDFKIAIGEQGLQLEENVLKAYNDCLD
jgi:Fe-S-cluster containining protein